MSGRVNVTVGLAAILIAACGGSVAPPSVGSSTAAPGATAAPAPTEDTRSVELTFMNWYWGPGNETEYEAIIAGFKEKDPRLANVVVEVQPYDRYNDVLNVKLAGNNPPDIAWLNISVGPRFMDSGRLKDLRPTLEGIDGWDIADFTPASLAGWSRDDAILALPFTNATNSVFFNREAFAQAGIPTPEDLVAAGDWNWESLKSTAKALQDSGSVRYGFLLENGIFLTDGWANLIETYNAYGGGPWTADGKTCTFDSPETVAATKLIHDMIYVDESHPGPGVDVLFATGDIGMAMARPDTDMSTTTVEWGVVSQPDGPQGYVPSVAQNGLAVFDGPNADIAALLVADMLSKENMTTNAVFPPGNRQSLHTAELLLQSIPAFTPEQVEGTVIKAFQSPNQVLEYSHPNWGPVSTNVQRVFDGEMWKADADVEGALRNVCNTIRDLLG